MDRRERERARKRKEMADAAEKLFREQGFDEVTMDHVAEAAEFSKRTLYQYFGSREELVCACIREAFAAFDRYLEPILRGAETGRDKLLALGRAHSSFRNDHRYYHGAIAYSIFGLDDAAPARGPEGEACRIWVEEMYRKIEGFLRLGCGDGSIRCGLDERRVALTIGAMMNGLLMLEHRMGFLDAGVDYGELIDESIGLLLHALEAKQGVKG